MDSVQVKISNLTIEFSSQCENICIDSSLNYRDFFTHASEPELRIYLHDLPSLVPGSYIFSNNHQTIFTWGNNWNYGVENGIEYYEAFYDEPIQKRRRRVLIYDRKQRTAQVYIDIHKNEKYIYRFGELFLLMAILLEDRNGLIVHSTSCLFPSGDALVFIGHSGAGKSTLSRLLKSHYGNNIEILSDDRSVLEVNNGKVFVAGTPWHSSANFFSNRCARLRKLFFIEHAKKQQTARPISKGITHSLLACNTFCTHWYREKSQSSTIIKQVVSLSDSSMLFFYPNSSVISLIEHELS